jgi:hypothetical protein
MTYIRGALVVTLVASACAGIHGTSAAAAQSSASPRYALAIEDELAKMGVVATCASASTTRHHCSFTARSTSPDRSFTLQLNYSDETDTVYLYVERFLVLSADRPDTDTVLRRLMELNAELLVGKFEWNPRSGEVRLGAVLNTDSNFDRRAFRSTVRAIEALAIQYDGPLRALLRN